MRWDVQLNSEAEEKEQIPPLYLFSSGRPLIQKLISSKTPSQTHPEIIFNPDAGGQTKWCIKLTFTIIIVLWPFIELGYKFINLKENPKALGQRTLVALYFLVCCCCRSRSRSSEVMIHMVVGLVLYTHEYTLACISVYVNAYLHIYDTHLS